MGQVSNNNQTWSALYDITYFRDSICMGPVDAVGLNNETACHGLELKAFVEILKFISM